MLTRSTKGLFNLEVLVTVAVALGLQERRAAPPVKTALKAATDGLSMLASVATEVAGGPGVRNDPQRPTTPPAADERRSSGRKKRAASVLEDFDTSFSKRGASEPRKKFKKCRQR